MHDVRPETLLQAVARHRSRLFGDLPAPRRLEQLALLLAQLAALGIGAWRGQASVEWPVDSSLVRRLRIRSGSTGRTPRTTEPDVRGVERALVERARRAGLAQHLGELELLARLQHHGAATRLLDCTRNAYVALWFACREQLAVPGLLIGFRLREHAVHLNTEMLAWSMDKLLEHGERRPLWWQPRELSPRIAAQQAVLVFSTADEQPWGSVRLGGRSPLHLGDADHPGFGEVPGVAMIAVTPELKRTLNVAWDDTFGFGEETLFPDFDGFAAAHGVGRAIPPDFPIG